VQQYTLVAAFVGCLGSIVAEVFLRNTIKVSLFGTPEIMVVIAWWVYLMGSSIGAWERSHITADILQVLVQYRPRRLALLRVISSAVTLIICGFAIYWAYLFIHGAIERPRVTVYLRIPLIYAQISLLIGFILMFLYFSIQLVDHGLQLAGKRRVEPYYVEKV